MNLIDKNQIIHTLQNRTPSIIDQPKNQFAVLLPIIHVNNELHILFEVRGEKMNRQPSEICFPGGRMEQGDISPKHAAIRETCEELGILASQIQDIYPIDYIQSGIMIHAFVGFLNTSDFTLSEDEVASTFTVPLHFLLNTSPDIHRVELVPNVGEDFPYHLIPLGRNYKWQSRHIDEYFYQYDDKVIWGLTARILHHFLEMIKFGG